MVTITFTCSRCGTEEIQHEPSVIGLPDGWRFDPVEVGLLCRDCEPLTE